MLPGLILQQSNHIFKSTTVPNKTHDAINAKYILNLNINEHQILAANKIKTIPSMGNLNHAIIINWKDHIAHMIV